MIALKHFVVLALILCGRTLIAQNAYDNHWIFGHNPLVWGDSVTGGMLRFSQSPPLVLPVVKDLEIRETCISMSNGKGDLIFYSNGCCLINAKGDTLVNSDSLGRGIFLRDYCHYGMPFVQGALALPHPDNEHLFYMLVLDFIGVSARNVYYNLVDMRLEGGLGRVIKKNQVMMSDTFAKGTLQAIRHVNGKDWWVIVPKRTSNCYRMGLITSQGILDTFLQCTGLPWSSADAGGQAVFTPDGKKYIRYHGGNGLNIYDFDTGTGRLSNHKRIYIPYDTVGANYNGVAVSPNSRYIYATAYRKIYQLDLHASDIEGSRKLVAEWKHPDGLPYRSLFYQARLGPDGKIYIAGTNNSQHIHVVHHPNCPAEYCNFEPYAIALPAVSAFSMPNFPHFRIWSDTTTCSVSTPDPQSDLCLSALYVSPNPARDYCTIQVPVCAEQDAFEYILSDLYGFPLSVVKGEHGRVLFELNALPLGTYFIRAMYKGEWVKTLRLVVVR